ncbi:type III-A CRISPR-associated RAMP protein Csm5 [Pseudoflavonifractor phocaeensis]|nr:type III-A CRISPR-associated RAMP protein Csm5 [Pseudoflavonifractor phocaeensis]
MEHLEEYCLNLTAFGPVFVGCGKIYGKNSYLFDPRTKRVSFIQEEALFRWLVQTGHVDSYEEAVLCGRPFNLAQFLRQCGISDKERHALIRYEVSAGEILDETHSLKQIHAFMRDGQGRAYVPGSSVKGALRTALLHAILIRDDSGKERNLKPVRKSYEIAESDYFNTLKLKNSRPGDMVNSIMRGISVADSKPLPDTTLILSNKLDINPDGRLSLPNLVRECIAPGTELTFRLTLDRSVLGKNWTLEQLKQDIALFSQYYQNTFQTRFPEPQGGRISNGNFLLLGGGSGFFGKTAVYPLLGYERASQFTQKQMQQVFRNHKHEQDLRRYRISPHCMKYTWTRHGTREFGLCKVEIQE